MASWQELPLLIGPRVQEQDQRLGALTMRFDNGLYLRVEGSGAGLMQFAQLRFAVFGAGDGTILTPPLDDAVHHIQGGRGYKFTAVVGLPLVPRKRAGTPEDAAALEAMKVRLGVKHGTLFLSAAVHPDRLEPGAPAWHARAEFDLTAAHLAQSVDYAAAAPRIAETIDDMKEMLVNAISRSRSPAP